VIRFNYLTKSRGTPPGGGWTTLAIDNRIRGPLAAFAATLCLTAVLSAVQVARLQAAQHAYTAASLRLGIDAPALAAVAAWRGRLLGERQLDARVTEIRRASFLHANELTWIGNHLPAHAWLDVLQYANGVYSLEGTADRASAVGTAMLALDTGNPTEIPQLVSLRVDGRPGPQRVHFSLRLQTQR